MNVASKIKTDHKNGNSENKKGNSGTKNRMSKRLRRQGLGLSSVVERLLPKKKGWDDLLERLRHSYRKYFFF
jgi:hypothetical protein